MDDGKCLSCKYENEWKMTGEWASESAKAHWSLWGCTCDPKAAAEAMAYMDMVTR